ncbi:MAG: hypothetical protein ABI678_04480 [Kofleriaceae bacterium]
MNDDDTNPLAGLDLDAWAAPPPPGGLADRVVARVAAIDEAIAVVTRRRRVKRRWWLAGGLVAVVAAATVAFVVGPRGSPATGGSGSGTRVAEHDRTGEVGPETATIPAPAGTVRVQPGLPAKTIERAMQALELELQGCAAGHKAKETIEFTVEPDGSIHGITTTLTGTPATCLERLLASQKLPRAKGPTRATYALEPRPVKCDAEKLVAAGTAEEARGNHTLALGQYDAALRCRFDNHVLQLSFMAACNSASAKRAQKYWKRMPDDMRTHMLQICLHNHITREDLDE